MQNPEVMDIQTCAAYLGISNDTLYRYAIKGLVPAFKLGNRWRFKRELIDNWMRNQSRPKEVVNGSAK
jgi:excisionase family DNA binding protein